MEIKQDECFFCKIPFTSDDYKCDEIERTKNYVAHSKCVTNAIVESFFTEKEEI